MVWVSIPAEKNDFLSASPGWSNAAAAAALAYSAHNLGGSAHNFPLATFDRGPPLVSIAAAAIAEDENGEKNGMTATRRHIMGRETIEYNDSASRVKLFMVRETSSVSSGDQSSRTSTTVPLTDSRSHRSSLFTQFTVLSPRLVMETEEQRRQGGESNRDAKKIDDAARKTEEKNETKTKGRQLTSVVI
jgi:hypothetical protein